MQEQIHVANHRIGDGEPTFIIAELSANHNQDFDTAVQTIEAAAASGADAIKLQTYTPDTLTIQSSKPDFRIGKGTIWEGRTLYDLYDEAYTPWEWLPELKSLSQELGLTFFSTSFDPTSVDFLEQLDVPIHKISSFEIVDIPLIKHAAKTGKPLLISTGMASLAEIEMALETAIAHGADGVALLRCASAYPAPFSSLKLRLIPELKELFGLPVGLSDHSKGLVAPITAVALGAAIVEKHFTLSRSMPGPDSAFSLEPKEFKEMAEAIRQAEETLAENDFQVSDAEEASRVFRRSLYIVSDVKAGDVFTSESVRSIRPGHGLPVRFLEKVLGRIASQDVERGTPLSWDHIGGERSSAAE